MKVLLTALLLFLATAAGTETWRGLRVAPENRCSPYDSSDYRYSPSIEDEIANRLGGLYYPYTGTWFNNLQQSDIEHMISRSEAHDSGLCAADKETRRAFASDLANLTLASPRVNRMDKGSKDAAEWLPEINRCWFVHQGILNRRKYVMTIDRVEADAIDEVLAGCTSTEMVVAGLDFRTR